MEPSPAKEEDIAAVHSPSHIGHVRGLGLYRISALAAGGAIQAAVLGLKEPCFALIRPPGHHASADTSWGFCYFNNMAVALEKLKRDGAIEKAFALDIDLHFGDGTVNIFNRRDYVSIFNPSSSNREDYLTIGKMVREACERSNCGCFAVLEGGYNHQVLGHNVMAFLDGMAGRR